MVPPISCIIHLDVPKEIAIERLMKRGRPDDTEEALTRRFDEYRRVTLPILEYYEKLGIPSPLIDGSGSEDEVRERITKAVTELGIHKA
jgi:adenylate kinase